MGESWSPGDAVRHFAYEDICAALSKLTWENRRYRMLDFASRWYGDPFGGWATIMRSMMRSLVGGDENLEHVLGAYEDGYDIQNLRAIIADGEFDIVVADQVLEHVARPWLAADEIARVTKTGGVAVVATPGLYPIHPSPLDAWRILPDGYRQLFGDDKWETLTLSFWGNADRIAFEYGMNGAFPDGPPRTTVEQARQQPGFFPGNDGRCPIQVWWTGVRR